MNVRRMTEKDYGAYCVLLREVHAMHAENRPDIYKKDIVMPDEAEFAGMIHEQDMICLAADIGGEMVGMCLMQIRCPKNPILHGERFGWIEDLCVRHDYRGQGIGTGLYHAMRDQARNMRLVRVELMVWSFNEDARRFYDRLGMTIRSYTMEERL